MAWTGRTPTHQFNRPNGNELVTTTDMQAFVDSLEAGARVAYTNDAAPTTINSYRTVRSRGTFSSPTAVVADDRIGKWSMEGYHSTGTPGYAEAAVIYGHVDGSPSGNFVPGRIGFFTGTAGAIPVERVRITATGDMRGVSDDTFFAWDDTTGNYRLGFTKKVGLPPKLTHGSGISFAVARSSAININPSGNTFTDEFTIDTSGHARFFGNVTIDGTLVSGGTGGTFTTGIFGSDSAAGTVSINGPVNSLRPINWLTASGLRWQWAVVTDAESGGAGGYGGATMRLTRYNNSGAGATTVLEFNRSNGVATFSATPVTPGLNINGSVLLTDNFPQLRFHESDGGVNARRWDWTANNGNFYGRILDDGDAQQALWMTVVRSGGTVTSVNLHQALNVSAGTVSFPGPLQLNAAANPNADVGMTIGMGGNPLKEVLAFTAGAVTHGMTAETATNTYFTARILGDVTGGIKLAGYNESTNPGFQIIGATGGNVSLLKTTAATGNVLIDGAKQSGTGLGTLSLGWNILAIRDYTTALFIFDTLGDLTMTTGRLVMSAAASKIVPGATSFAVRNTADTADNLLISNAGVVTVGGANVNKITLTGAGTGNGPIIQALGGDSDLDLNLAAGGINGKVRMTTQHVYIQHGSGFAAIHLSHTAASVNNKNWAWRNAFGTAFAGSAMSDDGNTATDWLAAARSGMTVTTLALNLSTSITMNTPAVVAGSSAAASAWGATYRAIQLGPSAAWWADTAAPVTSLASNTYYDGTNRKAKTGTNHSAELELSPAGFVFRTTQTAVAAGATQTMVDRAYINANGIGIGQVILRQTGAGGFQGFALDTYNGGTTTDALTVDGNGLVVVNSRASSAYPSTNVAFRVHNTNSAQDQTCTIALSHEDTVDFDMVRLTGMVGDIGNNGGRFQLSIRRGTDGNLSPAIQIGVFTGSGALMHHDFYADYNGLLSIRIKGNGDQADQLQLHTPSFNPVYIRNYQGNLFIYPNADTTANTSFSVRTNGEIHVNGHIIAQQANKDLGTTALRFRDVWATAGAFNGSLRELKTEFEPIQPKDGLEAVLATSFQRFRYQNGAGGGYRLGGIVVGDQPGDAHPLFVADRETGTVWPWQGIAVVGASVQALHARIATLEERLAAAGLAA